MSVAGASTYLRPQTLAEAFGALGPDVIPVAGGTDVILHAPVGIHTLLDLSALPLDYIRERNGFAVGAMTTLTGMLEHPGLAAHLDGVLAETLAHVGTSLLRNLATIGGHLARGRLSDIVPTLLALDATVTVFDGKPRTLPLAKYYADGLNRKRHLLTEVSVPEAGPDTAAGFLKLSRTFFDMALVNCACSVRLKGDRVAASRIVVGETPALGASAPSAEEVLTGGTLDADTIAAAASAAAESIEFGTDSRASAEYRKVLAAVAVRRVLNAIRNRFEERRR